MHLADIAWSHMCQKQKFDFIDYWHLLRAQDLIKEVDGRESTLSTRGEQVSGKLNEGEREEFEDKLRTLKEEWQKAKEQLNEQREQLEDGISSCMKHLEIVKQATSKASEIDQLLSEITTAKEENMETVETKTQVLTVIIVTSGEYKHFI